MAREQSEAIGEMRRASQELEQVLRETERMKEGATLQRFESGIRELNQLNALARAQHMRDEGDRVERRGSWNRSLADKLTRRASAPDPDEDAPEDGVLGYYAGAGVARRASFGRPPRRPSASEEAEDCPGTSWDRTTAASEAVRVVGSMTPALLSRRGSTPGATRRQSGSFARGIGLCEATDLGSRRSSRGIVAGPGEDTHYFEVQVRPQRRTSTPSLRSSFGGIVDSSATKVTGKVDYHALLQEQDDDFKARRQSTDKYNEMLKDVEDYQKKMLDNLDSQLVFMGISDADVKKTAQKLAQRCDEDDFEI
eukprot:Hpha_TRINITY_DN8020_c0_g1::TRINITY_DN8020_c0_g1_i1::g.140116::m.140116